MGGPDYARLTYLGILIAVIVGSVLMTRRGELGKWPSRQVSGCSFLLR